MSGFKNAVQEIVIGPGRITFARASLYGFVLLTAVSWGYILFGTNSGFADLVSVRAWGNALEFISEMVGWDGGTRPAYLQGDQWVETGKLAYRTLAMSVLAIGIAGAGSLLTFVPAA